MSRSWSKYQLNIFSFVESGIGNAIIEAVAGSGKSTTIVECMNRLPKSYSSIFLAFNKSIAEELKARGVNARTFHSLTYMPVLKHRGVNQVESNKTYKLIKDNLTQYDARLYGSFIRKMIGVAKQVGIGCLVPDVYDEWMSIADWYDFDLENNEADMKTAIKHCQDIFKKGNDIACKMVDFDDLLYFAIKDNINLPKFDFVFVDEAQDTNAIQRAILKKILKVTSRMIAVGDPAQAIYGFRGADSNSLDLIAEDFGCVRLPLTVSYRCPTKIVEYARTWVTHIEAAPGAPEGMVVDLSRNWQPSTFKANDMILCRANRPLIVMAYKLFAARVPAYILGRDIGQNLRNIVERFGTENVDDMLNMLDVWELREVGKAEKKGNDAKAADIRDKAAAIKFLASVLPEKNRTVSEMLNMLDMLFQDKANAVVLSTIHKAKGLEADNVFWLNSSQRYSSKLDWQNQQERNLCYVAVTRAKKVLTKIDIDL